MIAEVIDRLRERCLPPLRLVDGAAEWAALQAAPPAARQPAAYVMPLGGVPGANGLVTGSRQRMAETVAVAIVTSNLRDAQGAAAVQDLEPIYRAVRDALVGFEPEPGYEPMLLGPARLLDVSDGVVVWQETFTTAYQHRSQ